MYHQLYCKYGYTSKRAAHIYIHGSHKLPERRQPERQKSESPTGP